jgi:methyl-accepting chemotaxis protein
MEIDTQKLREILKEQREEYQRYLKVSIEDFESKIDLIAEQHGDIKKDIGGIKKTLDEHSEILQEHSEILQEHSEILQEHSEILQEHSEILASHTEMIGSIMTDVEIIKTDIEFIKHSLKKKVDLDEFVTLEKKSSFAGETFKRRRLRSNCFLMLDFCYN